MSAQKPGVTRLNTATVIAFFALLIAVLGAGVALALSGMDTGQIIGLLTALAGIMGTLIVALDKIITVHRINANQDEKIEVIERRTNGELDARIVTAIRSELAAHFGPAPGGVTNGEVVQAGSDGGRPSEA